ncbi:hypothetical protein HC891_12430 [Candidatus Gracilibacteria bacterium]|nr:hypothetical protein [Candidatus Gracilibacteria bacterium]
MTITTPESIPSTPETQPMEDVPVTNDSPFATTRLPDLPPETRRQIIIRNWQRRARRSWPALLIGAGIAVVAGGILEFTRPTPAQALPVAAVEVMATPTLGVALPTATPQVYVLAYHAPAGPVAGEVLLDPVAVRVLEQYQGWARFEVPGYSSPLWAPITALYGPVSAAALAAAPEIAATPLPATATPQVVIVEVERPVYLPAVVNEAAAVVPTTTPIVFTANMRGNDCDAPNPPFVCLSAMNPGHRPPDWMGRSHLVRRSTTIPPRRGCFQSSVVLYPL